MSQGLSAAILTREYPPEVYGGAGVHVENLVRELGRHCQAQVHCFGAERQAAEVGDNYNPWETLAGDAPHLAALRTMSVDLAMAKGVEGAQLVHSHTWYANFAGHLAKLLYGIPHVMTTHSLEPLRPWKAEQLGGGYRVSSFCEQTAVEAADAVIAVSEGMKADILRCYPKVDGSRVHVIHNGVDPSTYRPDPGTDALSKHGVDPERPYVVFVGRVTHQKGLAYLLRAAPHIAREAQIVLCAGEPDTPALAEEIASLARSAEAERGGLVWIRQMLPQPEIVQLLSHARAFVCPSIYEPFGIVNVEAMGCGAPVVASRVGGIPEIVVDGETGFLVDFEVGDDAYGSPKDPAAFASALADRLNRVIGDETLATRMGKAGRARVERHFSWAAIAETTAALYQRLVD